MPARTTRCVWLLDIDGVVNALPRRRKGAPAWPSYRKAHVKSESGGSWPFHVADGVREFLQMQHDAGTEIRWATTWQHEANTAVAATLGLPQLPNGAPALDRDDFSYKQRAALSLAQAGVALVWSDDDAIHSRIERELRATGTPLLLIRPDATQGLTPAHCEEIAAFLQRWR